MRLLFWRETEEELRRSARRLAAALANKREKEVRVFREVAETTGDEAILGVAREREEEARALRVPRETSLMEGIFGVSGRGEARGETGEG